MGLHIHSLEFRNFRNYEALNLRDLGVLTVLVGQNAVGKTNIIEGVQLLTALGSFRHATIEQLIRHGSESARLGMRVTDGNRQLDVDVALDGRARKYRLNGKAKRPADLKGLVPSVVFTPDDLNLVKGSMTGRRAALDALGSQVNKNYYVVRRDYEKVIRHKNRLLKDEADPALVEAMNEMVITVGSQLACYRAALHARLAPYVVQGYRAISGNREALEMGYIPSWTMGEGDASGVATADGPAIAEFTRDEARDALARALHERAGEERTRHRSLVGPHGDRLTFALDGKDATLFGSQGQQRSIVLAYKLAEAALIEDMLQQKPVLLLDDVMSELDGARREALVAYMDEGGQTMVTTANLAYFDAGMLAKSDVIELPLKQPEA